MKSIRAVVDSYLYYAIVIDCAIVSLIYIVNTFTPIFNVESGKREDNIDILSNIIGTSVSLAGFILASLTIIVAIRSNILRKNPETASTPLELFFSVGTYKTIIKVFKIAIIELIICFIFSYIVWILLDSLNSSFIYNSVIATIYVLAVSTIRSLFVLFLLIEVE